MASAKRPGAPEQGAEPTGQPEGPVLAVVLVLAAGEMFRWAARRRWQGASVLLAALPQEPEKLALASLADYPATPAARRNAR